MLGLKLLNAWIVTFNARIVTFSAGTLTFKAGIATFNAGIMSIYCPYNAGMVFEKCWDYRYLNYLVLPSTLQ